MKINRRILQYSKAQLAKLAMALCLIIAISITSAAPPAKPLPLQNGSFDFPSIAPESQRNYVQAQGWVYENQGQGGPGLNAGHGPDGKGQNLFWNAPVGKLRQQIPLASYAIGGSGDVFTLSYRYAGQGAGTYTLKAFLLVDGKPVATKKDTVQKPHGWTDTVLSYTATEADMRKPIGIEFNLHQEGDTFVQAALAEVKLSVTSDKPLSKSVEMVAATSPLSKPQTALLAISPADPNIRYIGRWERSDPTLYQGHWSGVYLRAKFTGTSVGIKLSFNTGLAVSIDGEPPRSMSGVAGVNTLNPAPLKAGEHTLQVGSGGQNYEVGFQGLILDAGATTKPVLERPIIEFVGDSITQGNGSYAWLSAEMLGCDHVQIAFSARALTSGFGCADDKIGLDAQYFRLKNFNHTADTLPVPWNFSYMPQIIVINLGQNDQCGQEPSDTLTTSYISFVRNLRAKFPQAQIVALRPFSGAYADAERNAVEALNAGGDKQVRFVDTNNWLDKGKEDFLDGIHPNASGSLKAGWRLASVLSPLLKP